MAIEGYRERRTGRGKAGSWRGKAGQGAKGRGKAGELTKQNCMKIFDCGEY